MAPVFVPAILVVDPSTGLPLIEARGAVGTIYAEGTSTPLTLTQDKAGTIPVSQPITITPGGYIPAHWNQEGLRGTFKPLSGAWSTPVWSPQGLEDSAASSAAAAVEASDAARVSAQAAQNAAALVGAPTDAAVAAIFSDDLSETRAVVAGLGGLGGSVDWENIPQKPAEGTLLGEDIEVDEDVETGTITLRPSGRLAQDALDARYPTAAVVTGTGTDDTAAVQAAFTTGGRIDLRGEFVIDTVSVTADVRVNAAGTTFTRKAGSDAASGSYWATGAAMFEVDAPGLTVEFDGPFTYDGNAANQTTTEPTGLFLKTYQTATVTADPTTVRIRGGLFTNGTSGYLALRGDNAQRRYETRVTLDDCTFTDTIYGIGKGDPATPNALGYEPNYILVMDYVSLITKNLCAEWYKPTGTGQYAACAIKATFFGADFNTSGEPSVHMYGKTFLRGMGRSGKKWDNDADYATNNGIGAIDMYGNADTLFVENVVAVDCDNVAIRAKGSLKTYTVLAAELVNCHRGLQVSPSTTGPCETVITVGAVRSTGGTIPQVEFTGTSTTDRLLWVSASSVHLAGPMTNPEALVTEGAVHLRNVRTAKVTDLSVDDSPGRGVSLIDNGVVAIDGARIDGTGAQGIFGFGVGVFEVSGFDIRNTGGEGISITGAPQKITVRDGVLSTVTNNGVFLNNTCMDALTENAAVDTVSGTGRGFYAGAGNMAFIRNITGAGVTTPIGKHASAVTRELINSWNV